MLLKRPVLDAINRGEITLVFRRWRRPTVSAGGTLRTPAGLLAIDAVDVVDPASIDEGEVRDAGFESREALLASISHRESGDVYRIAVRPGGEDPRVTLRSQDDLDPAAFDALLQHLERLDRRGGDGPWTLAALRVIGTSPGTRARELADAAGIETERFKRNMRLLKEIGLTESLSTGYRLSPRGWALLRHLGGA